jgi:hypothetical protein
VVLKKPMEIWALAPMAAYQRRRAMVRMGLTIMVVMANQTEQQPALQVVMSIEHPMEKQAATAKVIRAVEISRNMQIALIIRTVHPPGTVWEVVRPVR